ncbi:MAG: YchJ family metal-binding protein [Aromatoleum sp.]|jgi:SEC-C motif-containing protein|uniref:YchJ family protein n=1 Tax=Aromatoleum sp. TaxID=2307007 RepID=UPI00289426F1|nr:YchJ family metal-binding protein [Aromatoleum sp.]MDT3669217.1 YchJ family metal-binding protein [Aromatoleum sp.]
MASIANATPCPCQSGKPFEDCCAPLISGELLPETAEALMRSRYTAYTLRDEPYLLATWEPSRRPQSLDFTPEPAPKWIGLQIRQSVQTGVDTAIVEFVARYRIGGRAHRLHETSRFKLTDGRWMYVDGDIAE